MHVFIYILGILQLIGSIFLFGGGVLGGMVAIGFALSAFLTLGFGFVVQAVGNIEKSSERAAVAAEATLEVMRAIREKRPERTAEEVALHAIQADQARAEATREARRNGQGWRTGG